MNKSNDHDSYIIPPNFIDSGSFFGGMFKARNTIEAGVLLLAVGIPVFTLGVSLTAKIIILCLTALPLALFALIGIGGESLSSFALIFLRYLRNRRVVGIQPQAATVEHKPRRAAPRRKEKNHKRKANEDFPAEFDEVGRYSRRQRVRERFPHKEKAPRKEKAKKVDKQPEPTFLNPVAGYIPIDKVENGIIYTKDRRFIKILEVEPINFLLRSAREQSNIIYSFISFLKISPVKMQFKVLTKRADINRHLDTVRWELEQETDEGCRMLQEDYLSLVKQIGSKEAITRRFFIIFEYEPWANTKRGNEEGEAIAALSTAAHTAENYLRQCGNRVIAPENENEFAVDGDGQVSYFKKE